MTAPHFRANPPERVIIRAPASVWYRATMLAIFAVALIVTGVLDRTPGSVLGGIVVAALAVRSAAVELLLDGERILVRNTLRSHRIDWHEVMGVQVAESPLRWFGAGLGLIRSRVLLITKTGTISVAATQSVSTKGGGLVFGDSTATQRWESILRQRLVGSSSQ